MPNIQDDGRKPEIQITFGKLFVLPVFDFPIVINTDIVAKPR